MKTKPNANRWTGRRTLLLSSAMSVFVALQAGGVTRLSPGTGGTIIPNPPLHHSFVRDQNGKIVALDNVYAADVASVMNSGTNFTVVDIVMQQCFGGGFLDAVKNTVPAPYTFCSASFWSEVAWGRFTPAYDRMDFRLNLIGGVQDNFTRAWRQHAWDMAGGGMMNHFLAAATGLPNPLPAPPPLGPVASVVVKEPYSRVQAGFFPFFVPVSEAPQYVSDGAASDARELANYSFTPNFPNGPATITSTPTNQFAILVGWTSNLGYWDGWNFLRRIYSTLRSLGVPVANITVLSPSASVGGGATGPTDEGGVNTVVPIDASNTRPEWLAALAGEYFTANKPEPGDQMFIYNCGHGNHLIRIFWNFWEWDWASNRRDWTNVWEFDPIALTNFSCFDTNVAPGVTTDSDTNDDLRVYLDVSTLTSYSPSGLSPSANVRVNSQYITLLTLSTNTLPLDPEVVSNSTIEYFARVPHSAWVAADGTFTNITIAIDDLTNNIPTNSPNLLVAVSMRGGAQELLVVNTNSPDWVGDGGGGTNAVPPVRMGIGPGASPQSFNITWPTITNATVGVQVTHELNPPASWQPLNSPITNFGAGISGVTVTNSPPTNAFFRLIER